MPFFPASKRSPRSSCCRNWRPRAHGLTRLSERRIFETLVERERLGTTGVGAGIAIPHGRMAEAKTITGIFARLENGIDYEAVDSQPVDLVFMLLAPENAGADHLKALARVSRLLRDKAVCEKLRAAKTAEALYAILTGDKNGAARCLRAALRRVYLSSVTFFTDDRRPPAPDPASAHCRRVGTSPIASTTSMPDVDLAEHGIAGGVAGIVGLVVQRRVVGQVDEEFGRGAVGRLAAAKRHRAAQIGSPLLASSGTGPGWMPRPLPLASQLPIWITKPLATR